MKLKHTREGFNHEVYRPGPGNGRNRALTSFLQGGERGLEPERLAANWVADLTIAGLGRD